MIGEGKTRGQAAILDIAACNNQNSAAIRVADAGLPPDYLYRYLEGQYERTRTLSSGGNQPALNKKRVQDMLVPLPPLMEQHRIAQELERRLSVADGLLVEVTKGLARGGTLRQSILTFAFQGKLAPQDPNDEPASVLLERIRAERAALAEKARQSDGRESRRTVRVHNRARAESKGR
jgi:type I restriction enzyme S subunit